MTLDAFHRATMTIFADGKTRLRLLNQAPTTDFSEDFPGLNAEESSVLNQLLYGPDREEMVFYCSTLLDKKFSFLMASFENVSDPTLNSKVAFLHSRFFSTWVLLDRTIPDEITAFEEFLIRELHAEGSLLSSVRLAASRARVAYSPGRRAVDPGVPDDRWIVQFSSSAEILHFDQPPSEIDTKDGQGSAVVSANPDVYGTKVTLLRRELMQLLSQLGEIGPRSVVDACRLVLHDPGPDQRQAFLSGLMTLRDLGIVDLLDPAGRADGAEDMPPKL